MKTERQPKLDLVSKRKEYAVCTFDSIVILVWTGLPSVEGVASCATAFGRLRAARPGERLGFYTLISEEAQGGTLPEPVRVALGKVLKENENYIGSAVIAYEGKGFRATVVRSVITAIHMATRLKFPASVHSNRRAAVLRMLQELGAETRASSADIVALLHNLCARSAA